MFDYLSHLNSTWLLRLIHPDSTILLLILKKASKQDLSPVIVFTPNRFFKDLKKQYNCYTQKLKVSVNQTSYLSLLVNILNWTSIHIHL